MLTIRELVELANVRGIWPSDLLRDYLATDGTRLPSATSSSS